MGLPALRRVRIGSHGPARASPREPAGGQSARGGHARDYPGRSRAPLRGGHADRCRGCTVRTAAGRSAGVERHRALRRARSGAGVRPAQGGSAGVPRGGGRLCRAPRARQPLDAFCAAAWAAWQDGAPSEAETGCSPVRRAANRGGSRRRRSGDGACRWAVRAYGYCPVRTPGCSSRVSCAGWSPRDTRFDRSPIGWGIVWTAPRSSGPKA